MKVLVSGCRGFIGTNLIPILINNGYKVEGISRKHEVTNYKIHSFDLSKNHINKKIKTKNFEAVIHLAADTEEKDLPSMFNDNVVATLNILEFVRKNKIKKFVYVSGHNVYSLPAKLPIKEDYPTIPLTNYGYTKVSSEHLVNFYAHKHDIHTVILRVSVAYGNGKHRSVTLSKFLDSYKNSKPLFLHRYINGFQKVDLIHISDVCNAIIKSLKLKKKFGVYNIASGKPTTVKHIAKILSGNMRSNSKIKIKNFQRRTNHFYYDIRLAKKDLQFSPKVSLKEGIVNLL